MTEEGLVTKSVELDHGDDRSSTATSTVAPPKSRFGAIGSKARITVDCDDVEDAEDSDRVKTQPSTNPAQSAEAIPSATGRLDQQNEPTAEATSVSSAVSSAMAVDQPGGSAVSTRQTVHVERGVRKASRSNLEELEDGHIPPGSSFDKATWQRAVDACAEDRVVYELVDDAGARLVTMPRFRGDPTKEGSFDDIESRLFGGSLMVASQVYDRRMKDGIQSPAVDCVFNFKEFAHKQCDAMTYMVSRCASSFELAGRWPIWNNMPKDLGTSEFERLVIASQPKKREGLSESARFGGSKQRQSS
jgi:hypothetical protein